MSNTKNTSLLDLDINNYSLKDIEKLLRLRNKSYTAADVENSEYEVRTQLLNSGHVDKTFKRDLIAFLEKAKDWLIYVKFPKQKDGSTSIPAQYKLDTTTTHDYPHFPTVPYSRQQELIERPNTPFVYAHNSDFFPGVMNPLSNRVITRCLNIDSRFREDMFGTQASDYTLHLPNKISKVVSMQLASIELPITFYGISSGYGNNFLYLALNYPDATNPSGPSIDTYKIVTIPDGNYNALDLIDKLNNLISGGDASGTIFANIKMSLDVTATGSGSGKITIYADPPNIVNYITLDFHKNIKGEDDNVPISSKLGWNLGFIYPVYINKTSYTAETVVEPSSIRYLYLIVDDYNKNANNHFVGVLNKYSLSPNILAKITMKGTYYSILMENDFNIVTEPRKYFGPVDIQKVRIQLVDETGRVLQMNNANFSFSIILKILYDA